mmetsp:Transcript_9044/g.13545  ORF Transcript_9044/g.13545 Transcript_9044/m.13545 type:complete len:384 (+) Transcript_9044:98-1249(+)|eukprot:CAMPEP_0167765718 /NCGR_PEP_ID=MMETSP0110_2-20121227/14875_1 /TAXON_ID=629695 /ORGANISM="Gymnochlora sp., Strain CCMP2014" /LENGTH=383 /DNA_ID=CAMNT_0007653527 /DNA_START=20 /DNA_END=1171 /DNA_ORIENTATION=-
MDQKTVAKKVSPTVVNFQDLNSKKDLMVQIEKAFGYEGLGIIAVTGIPEVEALRTALFKDGYKFANLDNMTKKKYEHKQSFYSFGWSHGKEKLQGHPDYSKGSYYNNPLTNTPFATKEMINKLPAFATPNIWPDKDIPSLEKNFMTLGQLVVKVGILVARRCDEYISSKSKTYEKGRMERMISKNEVCKARLLHYFPVQRQEAQKSVDKKEESFSDWCGWHNDHSSLTGLVTGQFVDTKTGKFIKCPDPKAGLYIRSRKGQLFHVVLPEGDKNIHSGNTVLFQIGETSQIHSGGILQATPHSVRGANIPNISRESFAVFMQPAWDELMDTPKGMDPKSSQSAQAASQLPKRVPTLASRYGTEGCPFSSCNYAAFTSESLNAYH